MNNSIEIFQPGGFENEDHFYPKVTNAQLDSMVSHFFNLDHNQLVNRYVHLKPEVDADFLHSILTQQTDHFFWGGADLFYVTTNKGNRKMVVLETNSCPSGQKSMPARTDADEQRGYRYLIQESFLPALKRKKRLPKGALAVIYDKNYMEVTGYAATLADLTGEPVYLVPCMHEGENFVQFDDGVLHIDLEGERINIRAAFRYVTQKPWNRIPVTTKTFIYNSTKVCLAGGRNKLMANKAYEFYNSKVAESGLSINVPETIKDIGKLEVPLWVNRFGGKAVVKNPYSNAGQGVYTITSEQELEAFMAEDHPYDQFIVQSLIGHHDWSSVSSVGKLYHIGTIPNRKGKIYIADLRVMVYSSPQGFRPCAVYARRAKAPLEADVPEDSWKVLGTNLSVKLGNNEWSSETNRLMIMDRKDFNALGIGIDDLIEAYIQTVMSIVAIDDMAKYLTNKKGQFRHRLFESMDHDDSLKKEILKS